MNLNQLRTFYWVARLGGFRRASDQLHLSQPAISTRIATLEDELQAPLFERGTTGLTLTKRGALLLTYVEQMLFIEEEIKARVASPEETEGLFRIGASETIAQSWLPDFLKTLSTTYPRVNIDLTVDISVNLRNSLLEQGLDLALLMGPVSEFSVENVDLPQFELAWFKAAGRGPVKLDEIPVISYSAKTRPHRELMADLSRTVGPDVRVYSSASLSASLRMIAAGVAVGPYPLVLAQEEVAAGRIEQFDPGFAPKPLDFTASYLAEPRSFLAESAAGIARKIAVSWRRE
ncbi:LysR family transcriptional regulator [Pontivivens insulae]|uniref:HTH-type transcriptional regulator GltR n=1 Tax=Pontivivens insulae TaxID=1639689 RepID=A0A2R8ACS5_9RHOB|nr:LysR family transcriptional regulator [Pontivivens insulae]RED13982.1 LysR family transcriptional regulator [Pontivivens insulae]SPF30056.1 HTH-type transcriptional regulator GltR [Pontivivens insulae]